ncbi:putative porin [Flaviramulus sp. BrNp1-15]|uniref:putative porin n=1 Tax=Flaviramulus sp. BrNp1-15 TaxID=2916754 RepID=UPI001EE8FB59|nr:putative porin [Flaviramulus sp. BrNp1-15]ULC59137.1 putative porin [Flaviramulus sp. BrNp1-15]
MNKLVFVLLFVLLCNGLNAQIRKPGRRVNDSINTSFVQDTLARKSIANTKEKSPKAKIEDYLIISHKNDTTYVDTTLTIQKDYKFNYLRKDDFELIPFSNLGQTYNSLAYNFENTSLMPEFGARARHFNYMEIEDINYYRVPTPLTELFFKTAFEQGQLADSFFTVNTSSQFNFSIAYKGLRSLGKYQNILTSTGNFRFTSNYRTKNNRYNVRGHIVMQDLLNEENGGLQDGSVNNFESGDEEFLDRSILEVNFENAESMLRGKRFHLEHNYKIIREKDSLSKNKLSIGHIISFEDKYFQFDQSASTTSFFGEAFNSRNLQERATIENFYNQLQLNYSNNIIGDLQFNISNNNYNYGYDKLVVLNGSTITNRLKGDVFSAGGKYQKQYKGFNLQGELGINVSGDFEGNFIKAQASFKLNEDIAASASLNHSSKAPNYNTLLYQSNYLSYNWQNNFTNIETQQLAFQLKYKKLAKVTVDYSTINDYVYFKEEDSDPEGTITPQVKPFQNNNSITYLRAKLENEITVGKFALNNTILYQNVQDDNNVLNVPELTTRNTLYFSSHLFKKALYLQTGVTLKYFTKYYMNDYSPLLAEFYVQNEREFGDFPLVDFFINAKIRQTRIYLKAEHFNSAFTGYDFYSAPNYPYRDFTVRFGLVWNFFL